MRTPSRLYFPIMLCLLASMVFAQQEELNPYAFLNETSQIVTLIDGTQREVLISSPSIYHQDIADALRRAMVMRSVPVYIVTTGQGANAAGSYIHSLFIQGAVIRIGPETDPLMVLDREVVVSGPLLTGPIPLFDETGTFLISDASFLSQATSIIIDLFERGIPFEYIPENPEQ